MASVNVAELRQNLEIVAKARVLFGHQSVGRNILAGLAALAADAHIPIRIEDVSGAAPGSGAGLFHANIGKNGDAQSKFDAFGRLLGPNAVFDAAMMKLCYTDVGRNVPMSTLDRYVELVRSLRERYPVLRIVHITVPLRTGDRGFKAAAKRLLGRSSGADLDNASRNTFNDALKKRFGEEPIFDLAALESTGASGQRSSFAFQGRTVYTLAPEHTNDGGHLNPPGQRLAASALIRVLAAALSGAR